MLISYRQTRTGKWLVCGARPHQDGGYATDPQFGAHKTEDAAIAHMQAMASEYGYTIVDWVSPPANIPEGEQL